MIEFAQPLLLIALVPAVAFVALLIRKDIARMQGDRKKIDRARRWLLVTRALVVALLIVALAGPVVLITNEERLPPAIEALVDNSSSMVVFDTTFLPAMEQQLGERIPVRMVRIGHDTTSDLGDQLLANLGKDKNILLVSDGRVTEGAQLADVALFASQLNATVSAITLEPSEKDWSVSVVGPSKTVTDTENTFVIEKKAVGSPDGSMLAVSVDGVPHAGETVHATFTSPGYHTITASLEGGDFLSNNDAFYKTVKVVEKPRVLYVTQKDDPLEGVLAQLYTVEKASALPSDLAPFHAVILNDLPADRVSGVERLRTFVVDGNGLVVIGGFASYDRGDYTSSSLENLLPVQVGTGEKRQGGSNIVLLYDISGSTRETTERGGEIVDVERQLATSVIQDLSSSNRVSLVAFNTKAFQLTPLQPLGNSKQRLIDRLSSISTGGGTSLSVGLSAAYEVLKSVGGDRVVVVISDGMSNGQLDMAKSIELARIYGSQGVKIFTVSVGRVTNSELLAQIAIEGRGAYFKADESYRLRILFGEPGERTDNTFGLFIVDSGHFITQGLDLDATVDAYNQVAPKASSRTLVALDNRNPAITAWRYGIGRVVAVTAFSSSDNLGQLLEKENSLLVTRVVNWAIGDPERKGPFAITVDDTRIDQEAIVHVKANAYPEAQGIEFSKIDTNEYMARIPPQAAGFHRVLSASYAVSYEKEYEDLGVSPELDYVVQTTGGKFFNAQDIEDIVAFVRTASTKTRVVEISLQWLLIIAAIVIFLLEVSLRRLRVWIWQGI